MLKIVTLLFADRIESQNSLALVKKQNYNRGERSIIIMAKIGPLSIYLRFSVRFRERKKEKQNQNNNDAPKHYN